MSLEERVQRLEIIAESLEAMLTELLNEQSPPQGIQQWIDGWRQRLKEK